MRSKISLALLVILVGGIARVGAELSFSVTDLGTLGGNTSTANGVTGQGMNAAGLVVGSSTVSDNSEHAFLYANGQMLDLNTLCDLSQTDFKVLTSARSISDSCVIIGDGITNNGDKHAFMLTPLPAEGGRWSYRCCQWVWIQEGGGWWWEEDCGCYKWHGPPGRHPPCPPRPPPCWWFIPCPPPCHHPTPPPGETPTPPPRCWCCINGQIIQTTPAECRDRDGQCYGSREEALRHCRDLCWCCINGHVVQINAAECKERGGQCFGSREEAIRHCGDLCWCCLHGQVVQLPVADCRERDGQCFGSREEAIRLCQETCWCCINGQIFQTTVGECRQRDGQCYGSREEADRNCGRQPGPTPTQTPIIRIPGVEPTPTPVGSPRLIESPTPTPRRTHSPHAKTTPTPRTVVGKPVGRPTPTPSGHGAIRRKPTPTPPVIR
ncbi:MAG TPA: hypothetical protein VEI58_08090 [Chthoniobacterales bacterium]|nr:hypothetical protein [Chthoniobacterales bacterium]